MPPPGLVAPATGDDMPDIGDIGVVMPCSGANGDAALGVGVGVAAGIEVGTEAGADGDTGVPVRLGCKEIMMLMVAFR